MKVAIATHYYPLEPFIFDQVVNLSAVEPVVLADSYIEKRYDGKETLLPARIRAYFLSDTKGIRGALEKFSLAFGKCPHFEMALKKERVSLIHAQFIPVGINMLFLSRKLGIPLITHCRGQDVFQLTRNPLNRMLLGLLLKHGALFLTTSNHMREYLISKLKCPPEKVKTYYGGIDVDKFSYSTRTKSPAEPIKILMCGRLVEKKGFTFGIQAFARCFKAFRNARLEIIGDGPDEKPLKDLVRKMRLDSIVKILGRKSHQEVSSAMKKADIFMMPYTRAKNGDSEGLPNVLKEAMATGLAVVSTRHAGVPEIVKEGKTGYLADERDVAGLSMGLEKLIENPDLRLEFGQNARKLIKEAFDMQKQTAKLEKIYRCVAKKLPIELIEEQ